MQKASRINVLGRCQKYHFNNLSPAVAIAVQLRLSIIVYKLAATTLKSQL
jgi:hypothetical protein